MIYFHRISDPRIGRVSRTNLRIFRKLCGIESLQNVIVATTFWDNVNEEEGIARMKELETKANLFQPVIAEGGKIMKHDKGLSSAHSILDAILSNQPRPLLVQEEMAQGMNLQQTAAGSELNATHIRLIASLQREIPELREKRRKDNEARKKDLQVLSDKIINLEHEKEKIQDLLSTKAKEKTRIRDFFKFRRESLNKNSEIPSQRYTRT
jgi:hypothetical protein